MTKVSVIIPVYGTEKWVGECLDSVLGQTLKDIEVVCIDDASPDRCPEILDDYAARDERVKVIHLSENHHQGYGRNRGTEAASGKYIYYLDSDDMITPDALEGLYDAAEKDDLDAIFFDSMTIYDSPELKERIDEPEYKQTKIGTYEDRIYTGVELLNAFCENEDWNVYVQRQFWRRDYLRDAGIDFPEGFEHEDELFSHKGILCAKRVRYLDKRYFIRRYRENSVMTRERNVKDFSGYFHCFCEMVRFAAKRENAGIDITRAEEEGIIHLYDLASAHYSTFTADSNPETWFISADDLDMYYMFKYLNRHDTVNKEKNEAIWMPLDEFEHIYVYGAGRMAYAALKRMMTAGKSVDCVIVSNMEGNIKKLRGITVKPLIEVEFPEESVVVIATAKKFHDEIAGMLKGKNVAYFLYSYASIKGPFSSEE